MVHHSIKRVKDWEIIEVWFLLDLVSDNFDAVHVVFQKSLEADISNVVVSYQSTRIQQGVNEKSYSTRRHHKLLTRLLHLFESESFFFNVFIHVYDDWLKMY